MECHLNRETRLKSGLIQFYQSNLNNSDVGYHTPIYALIKEVNADKKGLMMTIKDDNRIIKKFPL